MPFLSSGGCGGGGGGGGGGGMKRHWQVSKRANFKVDSIRRQRATAFHLVKVIVVRLQMLRESLILRKGCAKLDFLT